MARDNEVVESDEGSETKDVKYFSAQFSRSEDSAFIERVGRLQRIGGFTMRDIYEAGVEAVLRSEKYQKAVREIASEAE